MFTRIIYYNLIFEESRILNSLLSEYWLFDSIFKYDNFKGFGHRASYLSVNF